MFLLKIFSLVGELKNKALVSYIKLIMFAELRAKDDYMSI